MNGRFLNLTAYVNSKFGPDASRLVLSVPINMAGIRFRCITAGFVGLIFQQNVVSLTVRTYVEPERSSRQFFGPLRKMRIRELRFIRRNKVH
jgi:hypothetical protein